MIYKDLKKNKYNFDLLSSLELCKNFASKILYFYNSVLPVIALQMPKNNLTLCWPCLDKKCRRLHRSFKTYNDFYIHQMNGHGNFIPGYGSFLFPGRIFTYCFRCRIVFSDQSVFLRHRFFSHFKCYHAAFILRHEIDRICSIVFNYYLKILLIFFKF